MTRFAAALAIFVAGAVLAGAPQQPTFSARTESVRVDVLVTEGGRIVTGLGPSDFEIRDEGVAQTVEVVSVQQLAPADRASLLTFTQTTARRSGPTADVPRLRAILEEAPRCPRQGPPRDGKGTPRLHGELTLGCRAPNAPPDNREVTRVR